jgi:hypothetical protein
VALGDGAGTFGALATFAVSAGGEPWKIVAADLDDDGHTDLATANMLGDNVSVLMGNGNGTFDAAVNYKAGNGPHDIIATDMDGDGKLDLLTANFNGNNVSFLEGKGDGTFKSVKNSTAGSGPTALVAAHFNGDTDLDLATANETGNNVTVLLGGAAEVPSLLNCAGAGAGCGPMGLMPFGLVFCGLVGMKRYARWRR